MVSKEEYLKAKQITDEYENIPIEPVFNKNDYVVLNPINELSHIGKNEIAVGVRNFSLMGQKCLMEYEYDGKKYKRTNTDVIPKDLIGKICSVQVYKLIK